MPSNDTFALVAQVEHKVSNSASRIIATSLRNAPWWVDAANTKSSSDGWSIVLIGGCGVKATEVSIWDESDDPTASFGGVISPTYASGLLLWVYRGAHGA